MSPCAPCMCAQGPVLEAMGVRLGAVSAIAGQTRLWVVINGTQVGCWQMWQGRLLAEHDRLPPTASPPSNLVDHRA